MGRLIAKVSFNDRSQWIALAQASGFRAGRLAARLGLSRRQMERYIRRLFASSPALWLRQLRLARAAQLVGALHSVKEIAYALDYSQVSTFCRQFKSFYGMTCTEYAAAIAARPSAEADVAEQLLFPLEFTALPASTQRTHRAIAAAG